MSRIWLPLLILLLVAACNIASSGSSKIKEQGIYECSPAIEGPWPTYRMDTSHPETMVWTGTSGTKIVFRDLNTGVVITLTEDSNPPYHCIIVEPVGDPNKQGMTLQS